LCELPPLLQGIPGNKQKGVDKPAAGTAALLARSFNNSTRRAGATPSKAGNLQGSPGAPELMLLVAEYERAVDQLKKRGEKAHMILALNEVRLFLMWMVKLPLH
jgi:hypothetical protein